MQSVEIPKELVWLFDEIRELTFFRTARTDYLYEIFGLARPILLEIAQYFKISFKELANYDVNSLIKWEPKFIEMPFNLISVDWKVHFIENKIVTEKVIDKHNEIKGQIACKWKTKWIAKIVIHPNDLNKVWKWDILVSQTTFPSFIWAMQKALAFITDEWWITCHAAIISREMNKPCIIGTKIATKVLKDGDLVEVDAENGVVRVLEEKK